MGKLYNEKLQLFRDNVSMKHTDRIPYLSNAFTWKVFDSEFSLPEAVRDSAKMEKAVCGFHERYHFDAYMDIGARNPVRVLDALGSSYYEITDAGLNVVDHVLMEPEEYTEYAKNPDLFGWTKLMKRKFPDVKGKHIEAALMEFLGHANFTGQIGKKFVEEYECPSVYGGANVVIPPYEYFFQTTRGIRNMGRDARKYKEQLIEAINAQLEKNVLPGLKYALSQDSSMYVCDTYMAIIGYGILSEKQFGEIYWPTVKTVLDLLDKADKTMYVFCEGEMLRYADYFQDIPKGRIVLHVENDDIFEVRKRLPGLCLAGGMKVELLGNGTPQECVDYAKKLIDELGDGYIFSENKMLSFKNDCKRENLLAVREFVRDYRR